MKIWKLWNFWGGQQQYFDWIQSCKTALSKVTIPTLSSRKIFKKKKNLQFVYILSSKKYNNICINFLVGIKTRKKNLLQFGDTCFSNTVFFQKIENFTKKPPPLEFITYELVVLVIFFSSFPHHDSPVGLCHSQHQGGEEAKWLPSQWQLSAGWNTASRREFY